MRTIIAALLAVAILAPTSIQAQTNLCADRGEITERLKATYGEKFAGGGLRNSESIFEVWMSSETGTWTIIMTQPNGQSCVMAAGTDWREALPETPAGIPG
ncbi:MAG: hypothetical protein AAGK37_13335 [Pseudomonadota bacterium]